jgi:hypothetical protein
MRIRFLLFLAFTALLSTMKAQDYKVLSMESLPLDMTAREHIKQDERGRQCAVFRIATQNITPEQRMGFHFECDWNSFVVERQIVDGQIWVWVSPGLKTLKIKHTTLGQWDLHTTNYAITVEALHTYKIVLQGTATASNANAITKQFLVFDITPKDAMLTVNGTPWPVIDGVAQKMVDFGIYEYRIEVKDYHAVTGKVDVYDPDNKVTVKKSLAPAFGYLKIEGDRDILSKASVYIDNANGSDALQSPQRLGSGLHEVRILHPMYQAYQQMVTIKDNETYTLKVNLNANFANVTLKVDADAEIWVNGEKKGIRSWTGNLEAGSYIVECRMKDCKPTREEKDITADMNGQTLTLQVPQSLTGMLVLNSTPAMAEIYIDGERKGETPMRINKLNVGKHSLRLVKEGYKPLNKSFNIEDGKTLELEEKMEAEAPVVVKPEKPKKEEKLNPEIEKPAKPTTPSLWFATANAAYSLAPQASFGFTIGQVKRFGWFISAMSNFGFKAMQYNYTADANGYVDGEYPYYTGEKCNLRISMMGGAVMKVAGPLYLRAGVGYGQRVKSWYISDGRLVKMSDDSWTGVDVSLGAQVHLKGFVLSLEAVTTSFKDVEGKVGVGYSF